MVAGPRSCARAAHHETQLSFSVCGKKNRPMTGSDARSSVSVGTLARVRYVPIADIEQRARKTQLWSSKASPLCGCREATARMVNRLRRELVRTSKGDVMKVIGLIGGMSWESSAEYYRIINQAVRQRLGGVHSAKCLMWSMDFGEIERLQHDGDWTTLTNEMVAAARRLESGGADFIVICTNTMHRMADAVSDAISIPLHHIADPTARKIMDVGLRRVGLLGTAFTMEQDFYKRRLAENFGLDVMVPDDQDRKTVHDIIYKELVAGIVRNSSREAYRKVIQRLVDRGAEAIIMGCTEIMLLVSQTDSGVPVFDTTEIHALTAVDIALGGRDPELP